MKNSQEFAIIDGYEIMEVLTIMYRKIVCLLLTLTLVASLMIGCGSNNSNTANNSNNTTEDNNGSTENNDNNESDNNDEDEDDNEGKDDEDEPVDDRKYPFPFYLAYADTDTLAPYSNYSTIAIHTEGQVSEVLLYTKDATITNLKFYALEFIDFNEETHDAIYKKTFVGELSELTPDEPVVLQFEFGEFMATAGFSYVDAEGVEHLIGITMSGLNGEPIPGNITAQE